MLARSNVIGSSLEKSGSKIWNNGKDIVSLPTVTTNHRCIGHQSSMKCIAEIEFHGSLCLQGWSDPEECFVEENRREMCE